MKSIIRFIPVRSYFFNLMLDLKRIFNNLIFGVLKPKIFIILFSLFFSSLVFAATLTVTGLLTARIPPGDANCSSSNISGKGTHNLSNDRTEDPEDVQFSDDGLRVFTINRAQQEGLDLSMNTLSVPFDLTSVDTSEEISGNNNGKGCDALDGFDPSDFGASTSNEYLDLNIVDGGKIFFMLSSNAELIKFNLSTPNDFTTATYEREHDFSGSIGSVSFSRDGRKLFRLEITDDTPNLTTFSLPGPFDISSLTQTHNVNLASSYDVGEETGDATNAMDIEFNDTGSAMFVMTYTADSKDESYIYQFSLGTNYDVSTASLTGKYNIVVPTSSGDGGEPRGFSFSSDGMKFFLVNRETGAAQVDRITEYELECPYGIVACTSDSASNLGSQVQLAKQNIGLNTSIIFKRFEWIKRNRNNNNLNNLTASIKLDNPLLNYWIKKLPDKLVTVNEAVEGGRSITIGREYKKRNKNSNNLDNFTTAIKSDNPLLNSWLNKLPEKITARRASLKEKSSKDKKSNWSYWSHGDISIGNYEDTILEKPKQIKTTGLTFGADKKYGDNKFAGLAIRYGENGADIRNSAQQTDMESLTLNIYGIIPRDESEYINAVLGLSVLRFDQKYLGQLTGERNGKQVFAAVNYRTKKSYGDLNLTPSGRFTYAVTQLSDFTNFISTVKPGTNIIYEEGNFKSGEVAAGFLFNLNDIETSDGIFKRNGGLEIVYDITPDVKLEYSNVNTATIEKYSHKNIRGNIGSEAIYNNGLTLSLNYERFQHIDSHRYSHTDSFLIKVGHIIEEDSEFAFNFDPLKNNETSIDYTKNINGFDVKVSSNYSLMSEIPDYGANIEILSTF